MTEDIFAKISGLYPTPDAVIELMAARVGGINPSDSFLEPSAGTGKIAKFIRSHGGTVKTVEPNSELDQILTRAGYNNSKICFEDYETPEKFNKIIMNPPFRKGIDMEHVMKAVGFLDKGGKIVSLLSSSKLDHTEVQVRNFHRWLSDCPRVSSYRIEKLSQYLFLSRDCERKSDTPMKLILIESI